MNIEELRMLCNDETIVVSQHCLKRIVERGIMLSEVKQAILRGEIIEDYPNDYPYPSCLVLGCGLHVVAGIGDGYMWLITAYRPDPAKWESDMKTRREV